MKKVCAVFDEVIVGEDNAGKALLAIRIAVGVFFVVHGYQKFFEMGLDQFSGMIGGMMGWPLPMVFAFLVAFAELFGGLALILGFLTRFSAFWLSIIILVAWVQVKGLNIGEKGDLDLLSLGMTVALFIAGPGALSLSAKMKKGGGM